MRFIFIIFCVLCLSAPGPTKAGPWLREKGTTFTATSFTVNYFRDTGTSTYVEYGWRDDTTVGIDIGYFTDRYGATSGVGTVFLRRALGSGEGSSKWAYEIGVGTAWIGDLMLPHVKTGLSWGRGYQLGDKNGWMTVDASVTWDLTFGERLTKVDATIGLGVTDVTKGILQLYLTNLQGQTTAMIAPSVVFSPREKKFSIQIGAESPLGGWDDTAIKVGLWRKF